MENEIFPPVFTKTIFLPHTIFENIFHKQNCLPPFGHLLGHVCFRGSENDYFGEFQPSENAKIHKNHNLEPLNVLKRQLLHF